MTYPAVLMPTPASPHHASNGARMVTADGRLLPLRGASLTADARGGVARVVVQQRFFNPYAEPLRVSYKMPLPADGAVSGFAFTIGDKRVTGVVDTKKKARERFEDAILEGRTAAILDEERSSLFTQEVGNIPPHTEVVAEIVVDQKLGWLPSGEWEWRFPTVLAPRYLGAAGVVADASSVTLDVAETPIPARVSLGLSIRDAMSDGARPSSPSHSLHAARGVGRVDVTFADEKGAALDRDVVVRWVVQTKAVGASIDLARPKGDHAYGLLTLVPPSAAAHMSPVPRDLILLLDTSGSMSGDPLDQAKRIASALVATLTDRDRLEMIEFGDSPRRWKSRVTAVDASAKKAALGWIAGLRASGGTEMHAGVMEALTPLRNDAQRQVVLMTDGLIGGEAQIVEAIVHRLPAGCRVHTVGIGSGANRTLTQPAARAGRGTETLISLGEDAEVAASRLVARTAEPLVTELEVSGSAVESCAPERAPDLYAGSPALLSLELRARGGEIEVRGKTADGAFVRHLTVSPIAEGEGSRAIATLFARESVEDAETRIAAGEERGAIEKRITALGIDFQISTRLTSWVAVDDEVSVDPTGAKRTQIIPQNLPHGMSAEGLGLRPASAPMLARAAGYGGAFHAAAPAPQSAVRSVGMWRRMKSAFGMDDAPASGADESLSETSEDLSVLKEAMERETPKAAAPPAAFGPPPAGRPMAPSPAQPTIQGAPPMVCKARLRIRKDGSIVLEFAVGDAPFPWRPETVRIELADGSFLDAVVDNRLTTMSGTALPGTTLVLALDPLTLGSPIVRAHLLTGGVTLVLEV